MRATYPAHLMLLGLIALIISGEDSILPFLRCLLLFLIRVSFPLFSALLAGSDCAVLQELCIQPCTLSWLVAILGAASLAVSSHAPAIAQCLLQMDICNIRQFLDTATVPLFTASVPRFVLLGHWSFVCLQHSAKV